jgi:guanylate kinase
MSSERQRAGGPLVGAPGADAVERAPEQVQDATDAPGLLLVLSAPSGAGKTTLARMFLARHPEARFSISATTRPPRGAERDGVDYHFVTPERFAELAAAGAFAEWAQVHGKCYGTPRAGVEAALAERRVALFDIDVQGGAAIQAAWPEQTVSVFVLPPSVEELGRRLRARSTDSEEQIARRLAAAHEEIARGAATYDHLVVNDDLRTALAQVDALVASRRGQLAGRRDPAADAIAEALRRDRFDLSPWLAAGRPPPVPKEVDTRRRHE